MQATISLQEAQFWMNTCWFVIRFCADPNSK